ncbi:hypothetical protein Fot_21328 [Forsythia ovata]|uniref:Uncharacterized protein n=1 Tax=Forsythia ovata TaxID=205694 RepID=A0ABD1UUV1_9LAMI
MTVASTSNSVQRVDNPAKSNATILRNQTNHVTVSSSNVVPINEAVDLSTCKPSNHVVVCTSSVSKQAQAQAHIPVERIVHSSESKGKDKLVDDTLEIKVYILVV